MKTMRIPIALAIVISFAFTTPAKPDNHENKLPSTAVQNMPLEFGKQIPLQIQSAAVVWKDNTYHLVNLSSIRIELDKPTNRLKAEMSANICSFDNVDYDVSAAVFDASGNLLGTARSPCKVRRIWGGTVMVMDQPIPLDFGVSLNYSKAATFMVSISERKVLTPDDWQK